MHCRYRANHLFQRWITRTDKQQRQRLCEIRPLPRRLTTVRFPRNRSPPSVPNTGQPNGGRRGIYEALRRLRHSRAESREQALSWDNSSDDNRARLQP
jgi:hypothetical protein